MSVGFAVVITFVALFAVVKFSQSIRKSGQKLKGRNRCQACGSRLKAVQGNYAGTCRKCGTRQTWAA